MTIGILSSPSRSPMGRNEAHTAVMACLLAALVGCGGDGNSDPRSIGGTIRGLTTDGLVLANGADTVTLSAGAGSFTLPTRLGQGSSYLVSVQHQPQSRDQFCTVAAAAGTVGASNVSNIQVECHATQWVVSTLAGSGNIGSVDGSSSTASFDNPQGLAVDVIGNLYVADYSTNKVRRIAQDGTVTTFVGSGTGASIDGTGSAASFGLPSGVAIDSAANIFVTDSGTNKLRKVTPAGTVTTIAGSGSVGFADGTGMSASFNSPAGVASDGAGTTFVADTYNNAIRKVTPSGSVTTLAGSGVVGSFDGAGGTASFSLPNAVALDAVGSVYVADGANSKVRKITTSAVVTTLAGSGTFGSSDGAGASASFGLPSGIAVDVNGNVYVSDAVNNNIRKVTPAGQVTTLAGSGRAASNDGIGIAASFHGPGGITLDASGTLYVSDSGSRKIRKISTR